jgi:hypothetical protein
VNFVSACPRPHVRVFHLTHNESNLKCRGTCGLIMPTVLSISTFKSLFNARFPSSLRTCQLRFQVRKLGANFATKFSSSFQCLNFVCKQMFILNNNNNNNNHNHNQFNEIQTVLHGSPLDQELSTELFIST